MMQRTKETEHFKIHELQCKCGKCEYPGMDFDFMELLEALRTDPDWDRPMIVSSAYRCPEHNQKVSSTGPDGPHTTAKAIDILCYGRDAYLLVHLAFDYGFSGIFVNQKGDFSQRFIHLDTLWDGEAKGPRPWLGSY